VVLADGAVAACWRLAERHGATLREHVHVTNIDPINNGVVITSSTNQHWYGRQVIVAAGGWSVDLLRPTGCPFDLIISREQVAYFPPRRAYPYPNASLTTRVSPIGGNGAVSAAPLSLGPTLTTAAHITAPTMTPPIGGSLSSSSSLPVNHNAGVMPIFLFHPHPSDRVALPSGVVDIDSLYHDRYFYGLSQTLIGGVKCGLHFGGEVVYTPSDNRVAISTIANGGNGKPVRYAVSGLPIDERNLELLTQRVRETLPHLDCDSALMIDHCHYSSSIDRHFILDRHPLYPDRIFVAAGFSGHGITAHFHTIKGSC
jgi:glycine/D-amino acid oxidase-like deaminating enzyme